LALEFEFCLKKNWWPNFLGVCVKNVKNDTKNDKKIGGNTKKSLQNSKISQKLEKYM